MCRLAVLVAFFCSGLTALLARPALANDPPRSSQPVRFIVTFAPGGGVDAVARIIAERLTSLVGQNVVVENRPGAAGVIAGRQVASADPDGRTVLVTSNPLLINQVLKPETNFVISKELTPVASVAPQSIVIVTSSESPASSLKDLFEQARKRSINYSTTGTGSLSHLAVEFLLASQSGVQMQHIPFQGAAPALTAVMAGQVEVGSSTVPPAVPLLTSNKLRALAVANASRSSVLPSVPTFSEAGFATLPVSAWVGFFVSAKTPKSVADRLSQDILAAADQDDSKKKFLEMGFEPSSSGSTAFSRELQAELDTWTGVAAKAKLLSVQ